MARISPNEVANQCWLFTVDDPEKTFRTGLQTPSGINGLLSAFGSVASNLDFVIDSYGNMFRKVGQSWADNIGSLNPGEGYLVKMNASDELRYAQSGQRKRSARAAKRSGSGNPGHFGNIKGDPTAALWTICLSHAELDGAELEAGDEIAIFDGDTLAGSLTLSETLNEENQYKNVLKVWSVTGDDAGYAEGNSYTFKCWDASEDVEISGCEVVFDDLRGEAYAGDVFPEDQNPYSIATLVFSSEDLADY